ncbi:hypothetical protein NAK90_005432 [Salmonella enterica]|nr:hypothetical protein [Salmonella enterica]EJG7681840.1 hypothetical protein [Salmonella enterica]HAF4898876.1 hypothetical protein [Salmonella enterica]
MFKKIVLFSCWLIVISFSLLFCFTLGLWQNWSTPVILLLWILILLLSLLLLNTAQGVQSCIKRNKNHRWLNKYRLSHRDYLLWNRWKQGAAEIKKNRQRRSKIPWYMLVGEQCGKSTLLANSDVPRFFYDNEDIVTRPTRILNWWFFSNLAVLDISSNFISDKSRLRKAWGKIVHWCLRLPAPAGVVIAIPLSEIMSGDFNVLHATARRQRVMLEPLLHHYGENLPLYVMITQCDSFPGFSLWQQQLSPKQCEQMLGYIWNIPPCIDGEDEFILQPLFNKLHHGLSQVRLSMAKPAHLSSADYIELIDFPEKFVLLEPTLRYMLAALCEPNIWFSHATLGGIWFSTANAKTNHQNRRVSVFIHDLLTQHLVSLSNFRQRVHWHQKKYYKIVYSSIFFLCILWLIISAGLSLERLQPDLLKLSPDALTKFIIHDERHTLISIRYLPFLPLFRQKLQVAELQLSKTTSSPRNAQKQLGEYFNNTISAEPQQQRKNIIQLAETLLTWEKMREGAKLDDLAQRPSVPDALQQRSYIVELPTLTKLALERYYMQQPDGYDWENEARQTLEKLVTHDSSLNWLTASDPALPPLYASEFWSRLPDTVTLSGIWTNKGESQIKKWMTLIERATGKTQPLFQFLKEHWALLRQNAWQGYISDITTHTLSVATSEMSGEELLAISQNRSPSMLFLTRVNEELKNIPTEQTQPWLSTLRLSQRLVFADQASAFFSRTAEANKRVRQSFAKWLNQSKTTSLSGTLQSSERVWHKWLDIRDKAVSEAITYTRTGRLLTRGLFSTSGEANKDIPLADLLPVLTELQVSVSHENHDPGIMNIWSLYQDDAWRLLGNAMAQSACWLDSKWKHMVIWPLGQKAEQRTYEEQQALKKELITAFIQGPGRELLSPDLQGLKAASYADLVVPLNNDFLRLAQKEFPAEIFHDLPDRASTYDEDQLAILQRQLTDLDEKQSILESNIQKLDVTSLPATVPEGAQILPIGTSLLLNCNDGEQHLANLNFAEKAPFVWKPGQCNKVTLIVRFPDFKVHFQLNGDDAWPRFISFFMSGEHLFKSTDFGDDSDLLNQLGIHKILVRYTLSDIQKLESVWQDWRKNVEQIDILNEKINSINVRLEQQKSAELLHNPLSELPVNIAQCK